MGAGCVEKVICFSPSSLMSNIFLGEMKMFVPGVGILDGFGSDEIADYTVCELSDTHSMVAVKTVHSDREIVFLTREPCPFDYGSFSFLDAEVNRRVGGGCEENISINKQEETVARRYWVWYT